MVVMELRCMLGSLSQMGTIGVEVRGTVLPVEGFSGHCWKLMA